MTPGARVAGAIEVFDAVLQGAPAEQVLTRWGRNNRFAGSKDRAAIRDYVFDGLRKRRSAADAGGADTGRGILIGLLRLSGVDPATLFDGVGHAPSPLTGDEQAAHIASQELGVAWNLPDWLIPEFQASLGATAAEVAIQLQARAPVTLRVNLAKATVSSARSALAADGVETTTNSLDKAALTVTAGPRKIRNSRAYAEGWVELQDASSQAVVAGLPPATRVLDYCTGGGGKALALAMDDTRSVYAHDIDPRRMRDVPFRAARAGADITMIETDALRDTEPFDLVLCDAPCSGSGAWRRAPDAKWTLSAERLDELIAMQDDVLRAAKDQVGPKGTLAYATCSVLTRENVDRVTGFLAENPDWECVWQKRFEVSAMGDGFYVAHLTRAS